MATSETFGPEKNAVAIAEYGIVIPLNKSIEKANDDQWLFDAGSIHWPKKALRLHQDLKIEWVAIAMAIYLMQQKKTLQKENEFYQRQLKRFIKDDTH